MEQNGVAGILTSLIPFVAIFAIFYFLFIRPQKNQQKKHKEMLEALKVGDRVVSYGGVTGEIVKIEEKFLTLRSAESVVQIARDYVAYKVEQ